MTSKTASKETTGTEFLMWATDDEMRAVRAVDLFFSLLVLAAREKGLDILHLRVAPLHEQFSEFASARHLDSGDNYALYRKDAEGICPAVNLYGRMEGSSKGERIAYIYYLHLPNDNMGEESEIMKKADRIGMKRRNGTHVDLLDCGRIALGNMIRS